MTYTRFHDSNGNRETVFHLDMVAVPEPGAALIGSLGMLALLRRRRESVSRKEARKVLSQATDPFTLPETPSRRLPKYRNTDFPKLIRFLPD